MSSNTVNTSLPSTFHLPSSNVQNLSGTADSQSNQVPSLSVNPSLLTPSSFNVNNSITGPITVTTAPHLPVKPISTHSTYIPPSGINTSKNTPTGNVPHHMSQQKQQQQANQHLQKMQMSSQQPQQQIHQQVHKVQVSSHSQQQNLKLLTKMQVPSRPQQQTHQQLQQFPPNVTIQSTAPSVQQGVNLSHSPYPVILSSTSLPTYAQSTKYPEAPPAAAANLEVTPIVTPIITNTVSLAGGVSGNQNFVGNVMQENSSVRRPGSMAGIDLKHKISEKYKQTKRARRTETRVNF
ncbi:hypothetical protein Avbf_06042 [Armadillidium vulgare]|nr:hypothetical protein Avbf_06042 [Armadillidium vulgare]